MFSTKVCFRNDDVNSLTEPLKKLTEIYLKRKVPITHAVEPGNVTIETIDWLKQLKTHDPHLIEIIQHLRCAIVIMVFSISPIWKN